MKVLHFYKTYLPDTIGGVEQMINQIVLGVADLGVASEVLSLSLSVVEKTIEVDGHVVHRCRSNFEVASTPFSASAFKQFRQLALGVDLIHYHFPFPFSDIVHFATQVKKPTLVSYHSDIVKQKWLSKLYKPLTHHFLSDIDHIVASSPNYLESSDTLSRFKHKASVIPFGLNKSSYPKATIKKLNAWREKFGPRFFLFVGVMRYYKGLHILVKNIHFTGFLPDEDKVALLELCYAVVFPSHLRSEAFGISLLEGAMYGKPLISCEIGTGTTYINIDKETGVVVPPNDPVALRQAMDYLWNNSKEALAMGVRAEARYRKLFTAERMAQSYAALYEKLLK